MKKSFFVLLTFLLLAVIARAQQGIQVSKTDAVNFVLNKILVNDIGKVDVFISSNVVSSSDGIILPRRKISCPYSSNWVVFVDDYVFANWEHPCRYIFINSATKEYKIVNEVLKPIDMGNFESISIMKRPELGLLKSAPLNQPTVQTVASNPHCYAVIISGGINDYYNKIRYWNNISAIYCTLTQVYGFPKENIYVHSADGTKAHNYGSLDLDNDNLNDIKYSASLASINTTFQTLTNKIGPHDQLYIFVTDHGGEDATGSIIYLWGSDYMRPSDFNNMLYEINASEIIFVMQQCHSGGFISDLTNIQGPHREIHTACTSDEVSYAEGWITNLNYDEFTFYWTAAARGYYPNLSGSPWINYCKTGTFPFSTYFSSHPVDYNPDLNSDGIIEMQEAFNYANNFDTWSKNGYCNPYLTDAYETPTSYHNIGVQEDLLSLSGISGNITHTQTISGNFLINKDLNVQSGITVTITQDNNSNGNLYFLNSAKLQINGNLIATGQSTDKPLVFDFNSPSSSNGIKFNLGSNGSLSYCTIKNAYYGIYCNGYLPTISHCTISNNYTGIYVYGIGSSATQISYDSIKNNSNQGIYLENSSPYINNNIITNNNVYGIYCIQTSNPYIWNNKITGHSSAGVACKNSSSPFLTTPPSPPGPGHNVLTCNNNSGLYAYNSSSPYLGFGSIGGYNSVYGNFTFNVQADMNCYIKAEYTWWGAPHPNPTKLSAHNGSTIDTANPLPRNPNPNPNVIESSPLTFMTPSLSIQSSGPEAATGTPNDFFDIDFQQAFQDFFNKDYDNAILKLLAKYRKESDIGKKKYALSSLILCFQSAGKKGFADFILGNVGARMSKSDPLYTFVLDLQNYGFIADGKYDQAINNYNLIKSIAVNDDEVQKEMLFNLGFAYYQYYNDVPRANAYFKELEAKYPDCPLVLDSKILLGEAVPGTNANQNVLNKPSEVESSVPKQFGLYASPNPFNPSTKIRFDLPLASIVTLKIYDILGREVSVLAEGEKGSGTHMVTWNAEDKASGIYIARIEIKSTDGSFLYANSQKLVLIK